MPEKKEPILVRIEHNGVHRANAIKVTDVQTGKEIRHITKVLIDINQGNMNDRLKATIEFYQPVLNVIADADIIEICPCCRRPMEENI